MSAYTQITRDNCHTFKLGTKVEFNYGPMYGTEDGEVVGWSVDQWGAKLLARTEDGQDKSISGFTTVGIGVYVK